MVAKLFSGSMIIHVDDQQMEFISIGDLPSGLFPDDNRADIYQPRNKNQAAIFHRLRLIESYGMHRHPPHLRPVC